VKALPSPEVPTVLTQQPLCEPDNTSKPRKRNDACRADKGKATTLIYVPRRSTFCVSESAAKRDVPEEWGLGAYASAFREDKRDHEARRFIAERIIDAARKGHTTLSQLTEAGVQGLNQLP
jgi:hypothetical protein